MTIEIETYALAVDKRRYSYSTIELVIIEMAGGGEGSWV